MKELDFSAKAEYLPFRTKMSRRAWYVVFGVAQIEKYQDITQKDVVERIHTLYDDIDPGDIAGIIDNYLELRKQTNVEP